MLNHSVSPPPFMESVYGPKPRKKRAADLPGIVSLGVRDIFKEIPKGIYLHHDNVSVVKERTEAALARVDMDMIKPTDQVNILCSEHGFSILGGHAYAEMIRTIKDTVEKKTNCKNLRLRVAAYIGFREAAEVIKEYGFDKYFEGRVKGVGPFDKGIPIKTEIGTLYGVKGIYDGDWFIHAYYDDPREMYFHRLMDRTLKAFVMSYARQETRSAYHMSFGNRSCNIIPRAIYNAPFVQEKYAFSCILRTSPAGITGIEADNDLLKIDRAVTISHLKTYGRVLELLRSIDECIVVLDGGRWANYLHTGGIIFGTLVNAQYDPLDLSNPLALRTTGGSRAVTKNLTSWDLSERKKKGSVNPAIKAVVVYQSWPGLFFSDVPFYAPTVVVGEDQADMYRRDPANPYFMHYAVTADSLEGAMRFATKTAQTDKIIVYDGSFDYLNLSETLGSYLLEKAPEVSRKVEQEHLPKWLMQRGIDPKTK